MVIVRAAPETGRSRRRGPGHLVHAVRTVADPIERWVSDEAISADWSVLLWLLVGLQMHAARVRRRCFPRGLSNRLAGSEHGGESPRTRDSLQFVSSAVLEDEG